MCIRDRLYGEPLMPWLATMLVLAAIGWGLSLRKPERTALYAKLSLIHI